MHWSSILNNKRGHAYVLRVVQRLGDVKLCYFLASCTARCKQLKPSRVGTWLVLGTRMSNWTEEVEEVVVVVVFSG